MAEITCKTKKKRKTLSIGTMLPSAVNLAERRHLLIKFTFILLELFFTLHCNHVIRCLTLHMILIGFTAAVRHGPLGL